MEAHDSASLTSGSSRAARVAAVMPGDALPGQGCSLERGLSPQWANRRRAAVSVTVSAGAPPGRGD